MFIVHGTKRKVRRLGWVADFCPICRRPQQFELSRVGLASHLYFISFGEGKLVGYARRCDSCHITLNADDTRYATISKQRATDFADLAARTMPDMPEKLGERLLLEKRIAEQPHSLDPRARAEVIAEPFHIADTLLEAREARSTEMDRPAGIGCLGTILIFAGMVLGAIYIPKRMENTFFGVMGVALVIGAIYTFVQTNLAPRRYLNSKIIPLLAKALRPLRPTRDEITETLARCKQSGRIIARRVKLDRLWREIISEKASS